MPLLQAIGYGAISHGCVIFAYMCVAEALSRYHELIALTLPDH